LSARVNIPALLRDINFHPNNRHARFCIDVSLGIVPDFTFDPGERAYKPSEWYTSMFAPQSVSSPWFPALKGSPATSLEIALTDQVPADESYSLMLTVGVRYGSPMEEDVVKDVKRAGVAKVIAVAGRPAGEVSEEKQPLKTMKLEEVRGEGERQATAFTCAAAACIYGWRFTTPDQTVESTEPLAKAEPVPPTQTEIKSSPEKSEELLITEVSSLFKNNPEAGRRLALDNRTLETHASLPFQEHHDAGGGSHDEQQGPDIDKSQQQFDDTLQSG
jgi:hypothetical protein